MRGLPGALAAAAGLIAGGASGATSTYEFNLPSEPLTQALRAVALAAQRPISAPSAVLARRRAPPLKGRYTPQAALEMLLQGSGLRLVAAGEGWAVTAAPPDPEQLASTPDTSPSRPLPSGAPNALPFANAPMGVVPPVAALGVPASLAEVTVTGTRIRGQGPIGSELITVDRETLLESGYATAQQMLQALPQDFAGGPSEAASNVSLRNGADQNTSFGSGVNLRGLGPDSTLVLINGQRLALGGPGGLFTDVSLIPSIALQRIEVLADGASAIYGSDAVAGVVNFIFRDRLDGAETSLRGGTADGDFSEVQLGQIWGGGWRTSQGEGHLTLAYEYYDRGALAAADRAYASEDLREVGGPDLRSPYASPGTLIAGGQTYALPAGAGLGLAAATLRPGTENLQDNREDTDLLPRQSRHSVYAALRQDFGSDTTVYAQALYTGRSFSARVVPQQQAPVVVPATNPDYVNPQGGTAPVQVEYSFQSDLGPQLSHGLVQGYDATVGVTRRMGAWAADLHGGFGEAREYSRTDNVVNTAVLSRYLADADPASAYNVFGSAGSTPAATVAAVRGYFSDLSHALVWSADGKVEGPLWRLPAGELRLASGFEYRREAFHYLTTDDYLSATPRAVPLDLPAPRDILAAYGEIAAPLVGEAMQVPAVRRLDLSLAGRVEHYSDFGVTANPKLGLGWSPAPGLTVRGSFGTSFRAPSFDELRQGRADQLYAPVPMPDPRASSGVTDVVVLLGNAPGLKPERATTWNAGLDLSPPGWQGFKATLSYFDVVFRDRIAAPNAQTFTFLQNRALYAGVIDDHPSAAEIAALYASPYFTNPYALGASSIAAVIDGRLQNLSKVHQSGIDFDLGQNWSGSPFTVSAGLAGSYTLRVDQTITRGAPVSDVVGQIGYPVRLRLRGRAGLAEGPLQLNAFVNFTDGYLNTDVTPAARVEAYTTLDLQLSYRLPAQSGLLTGVQLLASTTNVLNAAPPYALVTNGISAAGYDPEQASPIGRLVSLQLVKRW